MGDLVGNCRPPGRRVRIVGVERNLSWVGPHSRSVQIDLTEPVRAQFDFKGAYSIPMAIVLRRRNGSGLKSRRIERHEGLHILCGELAGNGNRLLLNRRRGERKLGTPCLDGTGNLAVVGGL